MALTFRDDEHCRQNASFTKGLEKLMSPMLIKKRENVNLSCVYWRWYLEELLLSKLYKELNHNKTFDLSTQINW